MRLGYFGGSFDPPHLGHLAVASAVADNYGLDRILLVPTASQPLKPDGAIASYEDRFAMVSILCHSDPRFAASDLEAPTLPPASNYTIDTLRRIRTEQPAAEIFVIVGTDAFHQLPLWRSTDELLAIADWIVVARPHSASAKVSDTLPPLTPEQRKHVHLFTAVDHPASATAVRAEIAHGGSGSHLLPPALQTYIREHHLYS